MDRSVLLRMWFCVRRLSMLRSCLSELVRDFDPGVGFALPVDLTHVWAYD